MLKSILTRVSSTIPVSVPGDVKVFSVSTSILKYTRFISRRRVIVGNRRRGTDYVELLDVQD